MTKRDVFRIILGIISISLIGGFIWLKKTEKDINQTSKKAFLEYNRENKDLFKDNDFNVSFENYNKLNFQTKIENPFNEIIETSQLALRLVLIYKKGTIKFINRSIEEPKKVTYKNSNYDKPDWALSLELAGYTVNEDSVIYDKQGNFIENLVLDGKTYSSGITEEDYNELITLDNQYKERKSKENKIEESKRNRFDAFRENHNFVFDFNHNADFDLRDDFELYTKDSTDIKIMPTINLFKVEKATLEVYLKASNTNGFDFNDKVKSINITDKWNNHFVSKKKNTEQVKEIYNAIIFTPPNLFEQGKSKLDSIIGIENDIFGKTEVKIAKSELVFHPKTKEGRSITNFQETTKIEIRYSKNTFSKKHARWNQNLSSESIKSIVKSSKKELSLNTKKANENLQLNWLPAESGKINNNVFTKLAYTTKTENESENNEISYYLFFNGYENVIITYSRNIDNKTKWDKIFLESLGTFDFKTKK